MTPIVTAVITGDNHLGTYYARLRPDRLHQRRVALQAGFARAVQVALDEKAHLFLIVGDLWDRPDPRNSDRAFVAAQLRRLRDAGVQTIAICGNHDSPRLPGYDGGTVPLHEMAALGGLHLLRRDDDWDTISLDIETDGTTVPVRIRGQSHCFSVTENTCPLANNAALDAARVAPVEIALLHYGVEGWQAPFVAEPMLSRDNLSRLNADLIAIGHLHARNSVYLATGALLVNPGATERMDWGEEKLATGCAVVHLQARQRARLEWRNFEPQPMKTLDVTGDTLEMAFASGDDPDAVTSCVNGLVAETLQKGATSAEELMLRLRFVGSISESTLHRVDIDAIRRSGAAACFHMEVNADELAIRESADSLPGGTGGFDIEEEIQSVVTALLAQAAPPESATEAEIAAAERKRRILIGAKDALLAAYQRLTPGSQSI